MAGRAVGLTSLELVALILSDGAEDCWRHSSFSLLLGTCVSTPDMNALYPF